MVVGFEGALLRRWWFFFFGFWFLVLCCCFLDRCVDDEKFWSWFNLLLIRELDSFYVDDVYLP